MKKALFKEDQKLVEQLLGANPGKVAEEIIPTVELDFGVWDGLDESAKEAVIGYVARFAGDVFRAFILDATHSSRDVGVSWGQAAIEGCLSALERKIRTGSSLGQG